jgi:choline dehydrogenase-like flavoprotein
MDVDAVFPVLWNLLLYSSSCPPSFVGFLPQMGGSESVINALIRGLNKHGGNLMLRSHVEQIVMENGRAAGVALRPRASSGSSTPGGSDSSSSNTRPTEFIRARKGVISNASVWDTHKLLAPGVGPVEWRRQSIITPQVNSNFRCLTTAALLLRDLCWTV